jgi:transcriptional regulator of acetoin/glycerol metabolism
VTHPYALDFLWSVDQLLPSTINLRGFRPNLLVNCSIDELQHVASELVPLCAPPVQICFLPGILKLAPRLAGTMLLTRVEGMTVDQQIALFDWLSDVHPNVQVVSVATSRIDTMVREGRFLEGLFYRLNVVRVDASSARLPGHRRVVGSPLAVHC